jgi:hypothetical protein
MPQAVAVEMEMAQQTPTAIWFVHAHKGQLRYCKQSGGDISCNGWTN